MPRRASLYDLLQVPETATFDEIKSAYRQAAHRLHPDRAGAASIAEFRVVTNAYRTLTDPERRTAYDAYLRTSGSYPPPRTAPRRHISPDAALAQLNYVLWDIEDLLGRYRDSYDATNESRSEKAAESAVATFLSFVDHWVLDPTGFGDHFREARGIPAGARVTGHQPYAHVRDHFYAVRARTNRLLDRIRLVDLFAPAGTEEATAGTEEATAGTEVRVIDALIEAYNLGAHTVLWFERIARGDADEIPPFRYSHPSFVRSRP